MNLVVDASVAVKWVIEEEDRDRARLLLLAGKTLIAPAFLMIEAANVLSIKVSRNQMNPLQAARGLETIRMAIVELVPDDHLAAKALQMAVKLNHPVYDCIYLACATQKGAEFITADKKLLNKLRSTDEWPFAHALSA